jgi:virulence factor Mce-like protein
MVTERRQNILTGAIAMLLLVSSVSVGVKAAFGAYDGGYELVGRFSAAGQGMLPGSDVKVRGVNIGSVRRIDLVDNQAVVTMRIHDGERVPSDAVARIRAKTLFGEKFVDVDLTDTDETEGPFFEPGDEFAAGNTEGGFELEQVLADTFPILQAIDPEELMIVIRELADAGDGLGEAINRSIVNGDELSQVFADNIDNTSEFLHDLALLSGELADSADDILGLADAGNAALPTLNANEDALIELLQQTGRLSNDVADLLRNNQGFVDAALGPGSDVVDLLHEQRDQVVPLVVGLRQYVQTLSEIVRIEVGDGTLMGAVKAVLGGDLCGVIPCLGGPGNDVALTAPSGVPGVPVTGPGLLLDPPTTRPDTSDSDVGDLLRKVLGA